MAMDFSAGPASAGLRASLAAAIAYDDICSQCQIEITYTAQAIILSGRATPAAAVRARQIIRDIVGSAPVWDRTISI